MKKYIFAITATLLIFACEKSTNYTAQIAQEHKDIMKYIKDSGIDTIHNYPKDSIFAPNEYLWIDPDSIIFHLKTKGVGDSVKVGDRLQIRFIESNLDGSISESYWTTMDLPYPVELIYGDIPAAATTTNCVGWQKAVQLMGRSGAESEFILPSKSGLAKATLPDKVVTYKYVFSFKILPK